MKGSEIEWVPVEMFAENGAVGVEQVMKLCADRLTKGVHYRVDRATLLVNPRLIEEWRRDMDIAAIDLEILRGDLFSVLSVCRLAYSQADDGPEIEGRTNGYIYIFGSGSYIKVGFANNPAARRNELQVGNPVRIEILRLYTPTVNLPLRTLEAVIHNSLIDFHVQGEWFRREAMEMVEKFEKNKRTTTVGQ